MNMKTCSKCGEEKPKSRFYPRPEGKDGLRADCKTCVTMRAVRWGKANVEKRRAYSTKWRNEHPEEFRKMVYAWNSGHKKQGAENRAAWAKANPGKIRNAVDIYQEANPGKVRAIAAARNAQKARATPAWADQRLIQFKYDLAARMTKATGYQWDVDHIVPLRNPRVCGLHVEGNLQVITHAKNMSKGNRWTGENIGAGQ